MNVNNSCQKRTIDGAECSSVWIEVSTSPRPSKRIRPRVVPRRSIHFADDDHSTTTTTSTSSSSSSSRTKPLHTIYHVENWMNVVDKEDLWVHPHETLQNVMSIRARGMLYQQQLPITSSHRTYSEALQASFLHCCNDAEDDSEQYRHLQHGDVEAFAPSEICQEFTNPHHRPKESLNYQLNYQLLGLHRGIEAYCVPMLAVARLSVRKNLIQTIVLMDQVLRCHPQRDLLLGNIIRPLTIPSKRFAHMMGMVDELNACSTTASIPTDSFATAFLSANAVAA